MLSFTSANGGKVVVQRETLELWQYVLQEDWRVSKMLQADFGDQEGSRLWFGNERAVAGTVQWIKDDVLSSLHALHGSPEQPGSFKPIGELADMAGPRFQHFLFLPCEFCTDGLPTLSLERGKRHVRYSAHCSSCLTYLAALECPDRGEQTRAEIVQVFEQLDLSAVWGETTVEYANNMKSASVSVLSITYPEHYAAAASKKNISGAHGSRPILHTILQAALDGEASARSLIQHEHEQCQRNGGQLRHTAIRWVVVVVVVVVVSWWWWNVQSCTGNGCKLQCGVSAEVHT
eukprot:12401723-Karenia_brevis.AAC.1